MSLTDLVGEGPTEPLEQRFPKGPGRSANNQAAGRYTPPRVGRHRAPEIATPKASPLADTAVIVPLPGEQTRRIRTAPQVQALPQRRPGESMAAELVDVPGWASIQIPLPDVHQTADRAPVASFAGGRVFPTPTKGQALAASIVESWKRLRANAEELLRLKRGDQ